MFKVWKKLFGKNLEEESDQRLLELERLLSNGRRSQDTDKEEESDYTYKINEYTHLTTIYLEDLECLSCVSSIKKILSQKPGIDVSSLEVSLVPSRVLLKHDSNIIRADEILDVLNKAKYGASRYTTSLIAPSNVEELNQGPDNFSIFSLVTKDLLSNDNRASISTVLREHDGIIDMKFETNSKLCITYNHEKTKKREIIEKLKNMKFSFYLDDGTNEKLLYKKSKDASRKRFARLMVAYVVGLLELLIGILPMSLPEENIISKFINRNLFPNVRYGVFLIFLCASIAQFYVGYPLYVNTYKSFYRRSIDMDVLLSTSTTTAYIYFLYQILSGKFNVDTMDDYSFVESSIFVIMFTTMGRHLEAITYNKMYSSIKKLSKLAPEVSTVVISDTDSNHSGNQIIVPTSLIEKNELVKVFKDQRFPCDGIIYKGNTLVDESSTTGESVLVYKKSGDYVSCGTTNAKYSVIIKALRVGDQTSLSKIISMIEQVQNSKSSIQILANRITQHFLPAVLVLSIFTFIYWYVRLTYYDSSDLLDYRTPFELSMIFAISVLVVACPCSVGLAMPTAAFAGTSLCAKYGILAKGGSLVFELASKLKVVAFDKTNTLTTGEIKCNGSLFFIDEEHPSEKNYPISLSLIETLKILSEIAKSSSHPLSAPICTFVNEKLDLINKSNPKNDEQKVSFEILETDEKYGSGLVSSVKIIDTGNLYKFYVGNSSWIKEGLDLDAENMPNISNVMRKCIDDGDSLVFFGAALDNSSSITTHPEAKFLGVMSFCDAVRPESKDVVSNLNKMGIHTYIITGDNNFSASKIAVKVGIDSSNVFSGVTPISKEKILRLIKDTHKKNNPDSVVAMVGDGINDSVALAGADLSIAIGSGSEIAVDCAQVVLSRSNLTGILSFYKASKFIYKRIKYNFFWAFAYNVLSIPIAMGVFYPKYHLLLLPSISSVLMTASCLSVLINSLSIKFYKPSFS